MHPIDLAVDETAAFILAHLPRAPSPLQILDVGCGNGRVASRLQTHGHKVVAIDDSEEMVLQARNIGVDARVAAWPSFEHHPCDVVLFVRSLHHLHPLAKSVEQAHRLLVPAGRVIVEDFAWSEIDPVTAEWFTGIARLLDRCHVLIENESSFVTDLLRGDGSFAFWQGSHEHDLHSVTAMWSALQDHFLPLSETRMPYLYRYFCPVLAKNEDGYAIVSQVLEIEQRLAQLGTLIQVGRRFVGEKQ